MKLTGKARADFVRWYVKSPYFPHKISLAQFDHLPLAFQWGVFVEFFDSVGKVLDIQPIIDYEDSKYTHIEGFLLNITKLNEEMDDTFFGEFKTRAEACKSALEKAQEIHNT